MGGLIHLLLVLVVVVVPIIIIASLVSLSSRLKAAQEELQSVTRRLSQVELQLYQWEQTAAQPATPPTPAAEATQTRVELREPIPTSPAEVSAPAEVPTASQPAPLPPLLEPEPAWGQTSEAAPPLPSFAPAKPALAINWEQFMGVKLFAWIGGLALFLGVAFFVKYSFDRNLIPPELRVAIGFFIGLGLLVSGVLLKRRELTVTAQSLCATGVVILYAVTFACRSVYHFSFFGPLPTFLLMVLITATAFTLAVQLEALVVAILGLVGGFLTPILLSTGQDNPLGLFTYIALLDVGLLAVAFRRRWDFLSLMGAVGTVLMQLGWVAKFFAVEKVFVAMAVFLGFDLLFALAFLLGERFKQSNDWLSGSALGLPFFTFAFAFYLLSFAALGARPGVIFSFALGADLVVLGMVLLQARLHRAHMAAGAVLFVVLTVWTSEHLTPALLNWALGLYLFFAALHALFPVLLARWRPEAARTWFGHLFPPLALLLILFPIFKEQSGSFLIWPAVLLIDVLAIGLALLTYSILSVLVVLALTVLLTAAWLVQIPAELTGLPAELGVIGGFAVFFFAIGILATKHLLAHPRRASDVEGLALPELSSVFGGQLTSEELMAQVPAFSAILPFLLLMMVSLRLPLTNPSPVFGLAMFLVILLLGLALTSGLGTLVPVSLACVLGLEYVWHQEHFVSDAPWIPLLWYGAFYLVYTIFPFGFSRKVKGSILPWASSALAGPLQFFLIYRTIAVGFPNPYLGIVPAALAMPMLMALAYVARSVPEDEPTRLSLLAWFGGSALFFITLIFPIQFERQWITIGWALEGLALLWLFHRVPHPGLRATGVVLLAIAFARLALNPAVLDYHRSSATRVFNWYLYAYGIVIACLLLGARLLAPPRNLVWKRNMPPFLYSLGTILAFLIVNIEIADYFAEGSTLTFQFSGNFARDMSYSMAWALFALGLLVIGIWKKLSAVRYGAMGLLIVTLLKLFLHDLSQLGSLYRIGAFMVVAVILMLASFLYQRFVSFGVKQAKAHG